MRKNHLLTVLSLFLLVPASITWAQTITTQKGLTIAVFSTSSGTIKVYLPDDIRPGDVISGRIIVEPNGKNAKQVEKNLADLKKYSVGFNDEKFSVNNTDNPFQILVHPDRQVQSPMELLNVRGFKAQELFILAKPVNEQKPTPTECMIPSHALTGSPLRVTGPFDGNSSNTKCSLDNKPLEVLAESPRQCIISYPVEARGIQTLNVQETERQSCTQTISGVEINISAGKLDLRKGERTYIDIAITGLQNLPDTAMLTLNNITTAVIVMQPANNVVIPLSPDSTSSGTFKRRFDIQSIRTGSFTVDVNLDLPDAGDKDIVPPVFSDIPKTGAENKTDTIPCKELEESLKKLEDQLQGLKNELAGIDGQIRTAKLALIDCNNALKAALDEYSAAKKAFDFQDRRIDYWKTDKKAIPTDVQKDYDDAKKAKDIAAKKWSDQNKECKKLEQKIAQLEARKKELPGLIKTAEDNIDKLKTEIEKCKKKAAEEKKKKEEEQKGNSGTQPSGGETIQPGETDKGKEGSPCNPEGATITETKRIYEPCEVDKTEVTPCNMSKSGNDAMEAIKKFLDNFKKLSKPLEIAEKLADCASIAKAICMNIHIIRKWKDIENKYECVNGKWVLMNKKVVGHGEADYGYFQVKDKEVGSCCWVFDGSKAMEQELANAIQQHLDQCK